MTIGKEKPQIEDFKNMIKKRMKIKDLGEARHLLSMKNCQKPDGSMTLYQTTYMHVTFWGSSIRLDFTCIFYTWGFLVESSLPFELLRMWERSYNKQTASSDTEDATRGNKLDSIMKVWRSEIKAKEKVKKEHHIRSYKITFFITRVKRTPASSLLLGTEIRGPLISGWYERNLLVIYAYPILAHLVHQRECWRDVHRVHNRYYWVVRDREYRIVIFIDIKKQERNHHFISQ